MFVCLPNPSDRYIHFHFAHNHHFQILCQRTQTMARAISPSNNSAYISYAMPVSVPQLAARLMAYASTKASITTFRLSVKKSDVTAIRKLPEEILTSITGYIRDLAFWEDEIKKFVGMMKCFAHECRLMSHVNIKAPIEKSIGYYEADLEGEALDKHSNSIDFYCDRLTDLNGNSKIAKSAQVRIA